MRLIPLRKVISEEVSIRLLKASLLVMRRAKLAGKPDLQKLQMVMLLLGT